MVSGAEDPSLFSPSRSDALLPPLAEQLEQGEEDPPEVTEQVAQEITEQNRKLLNVIKRTNSASLRKD